MKGFRLAQSSQESEETSILSETLHPAIALENENQTPGQGKCPLSGAADLTSTYMRGSRPLWLHPGYLSVLLDTVASSVAQLRSFGADTMTAILTVLMCFYKMGSEGGSLLVCKETTTPSGSGSSVQPSFSGGSGEEITCSRFRVNGLTGNSLPGLILSTWTPAQASKCLLFSQVSPPHLGQGPPLGSTIENQMQRA
jgi:hypothetical protein